MRSLLVLALILGIGCASRAHAITVIVPDHHPTIQAALDNPDADVVQVRPGRYEESLSITRAVTLEALPQGQVYVYYYLPSVKRVSVSTAARDVHIRGLRFTNGGIVYSGGGTASIEGCRFDSSLVFMGSHTYGFLRNCVVFGDVRIEFQHSDVVMNTIVGGTLTVLAGGDTGVHDNVVVGPASLGLYIGSDVQGADNYVRGCVDGVQLACDSYARAERTVVEDCSRHGFTTAGPPNCASGTLIDNVVRRCGGSGYELLGISRMIGNTVDAATGTGINVSPGIGRIVERNTVRDVGGLGIFVSRGEAIRGNTVLRAAGDGITGARTGPVEGNIVGRSGGRGIVVTEPFDGAGHDVRSNTVYLNADAGIDVAGGGADSITGNIAHQNGLGLRWAGTGSAFLGCNDWFQNTGGATQGVGIGATDFSVDPQFVDVAHDDVHLLPTSPLWDWPGCGRIGVPLGAGTIATSRADGLHVYPQPGMRHLRFTWTPFKAAGEIAVYDVAGARRFHAGIEAGRSEWTWTGVDDDGRALPAGVYFARLRGGASEAQTRVVLVH